MKKVWVNGAFDVLHIGHIKLLEYAKSLGSVRVGLDTDSRIKMLKGENRPVNTLRDRVDFLHAIKHVNSVAVFDTEERLIDLIKLYEPDYMVIGSDYKDKRIIGREYVKEVIFFDRIADKSTTNILQHEKDISNR
jgi:D-beta-D-heptose 7-phosphate kinase/D-beta-D-heptose 1-phosphate adenosyltransferase